MTTTVVVLDDYEGVFARSPAMESLRDECKISIYSAPAGDREELLRRLAGAEVVVPIRERTAFPKEVLEGLESLRLIVQTGTGVAHIDLEAARERSITVSNMPGVSNASVAELTLLLALSCLRGLPEHVSKMREGGWAQRPGRELAGKVFGVVGFGSIGKEVARLAKAFRAKVVAWSPSLNAGRAWCQEVKYAPLDQLLAQADIVSIHLGAVPKFSRLLDRDRLEAMKRGAILINTSRAELIDMDVAVELLREGHLASAAFDVFDVEPLPAGDPIRKLPNVTLTPHIGWVTEDLLDKFALEAAEKIRRFMAGKLIPDTLEYTRTEKLR
jgi:phosphoglycerate dehydrogenase-like enzyme